MRVVSIQETPDIALDSECFGLPTSMSNVKSGHITCQEKTRNHGTSLERICSSVAALFSPARPHVGRRGRTAASFTEDLQLLMNGHE